MTKILTIKDIHSRMESGHFILVPQGRNTGGRVVQTVLCRSASLVSLQICEFAPQGVGLEVGCGEWTIAS